MPNFQPSSIINFTGNIAGSPAATVVVNANTAFTGTAKYRTAGAPSSLVVPTGVSVTTNSNATKNIRVNWATYSPGINQADVIGLFYRKDNLIPTYIDSCIVMNVNTNTPAYYDFQGVNPTDAYSFGIAAGRRTESGVEWGLINTTYGTSPYYLYEDDLVPTAPTFANAAVSPLTEYTPNGEIAYRVTDTNTTFLQAQWATPITAPGTRTRFMAEAFIKQDVTATNRGIIRLSSGNNSYRDIVIDYTNGNFVNNNGPALSPEWHIETYNVNGINWYRYGISATVSPDVVSVGVEFYPALSSPGLPVAYSPDITGSGTIGGVTVRRVSNTNAGFDWTAISPDLIANFTGSIDGSPASQVRAAAAQGATVFTNFNANNDRNNTIPTAPTVSPDTGAVAHVINTDGSADLSFDWQYSPSLNVASANNIDGFIVYVRSSLSSSTYTMNTTPAEETTYTVDSARRAFILPGVPANRYYTFGVRAYRSVDSDIDSTGSKVSSIIQPSDVTQNPYLPTANVAFAGNITGTIDGSPAPLVRAHASGAFTGTANYRQDVSPSSDPSLGTITQSATADGNVVVKIPFTYSPGSIPADFILVYTKENGGTISPAVQAYPTNPVSGDMSFILKPSTTYRFGVQAVRRTESGLKGGNILSSADIALTSPNYTGLIAGVSSNTVTTVVSNFNSSNDRNGISPTAPTLTNTIADYAPIILNTDGTCDIEFNWSYTNGSPLAANNVDGFIVYVQSFNYPNNYTFTGFETSSVIPVANTSSYGYTFKNLPAHQWHNMAVRAYRVVDSDVASPSTLYSNFTTSTYNNSRGITSTAKFPIGQKTHISSSSPTWDNLIPNDNYISGAGWVQQNTSVIQSTTEFAPDGKTFAYELQDSGSVSPDLNHSIYRTITPAQNKYFVFKGFVKRKGADRGIYIRFGTAAFGGTVRNFQFEISPLSMAFPASGAGHGAIRPLENGWYEFFTSYPVTSPNGSFIQLMVTKNGSIAYSAASPDGMYFANLAAYNVDGIIGVSPGLPSVMDVVGSTWYDTTTSSLKIWNGSRWIESSTVGAIYGTSPSNLTGLSGDGENRIPQRYSGGFATTEGDANITDKNRFPIWLGSPSRSTGIELFSVTALSSPDNDLGPQSGFYGSHAIKIKFNGNTTGREVYFASSPAAYNISLVPNSKWIVSGKGWLSSPSTVPFTAQLGLLTAVSPTTGYRASSSISTRKTWTDLSGTLNLINDSSTFGTLVAGATGGGVGGSPYLWLDGLMLERKVGPGSTPTPWSKGSQYGKLGTNKGSLPVPPSNIAVGTLLNGMTLNQGDGNSRPILGGFYVSSARDTDNIIFPTPYATIPTVVFFPGAQTTGSPFSNTTNVSTICEAQNLTTTGFTARIRFIGQASGVSPITDTVNFGPGSPSVLSPGSPDSAGYTGAPSPAFAINKTNGSEAFDDKYKYTFNVTVYNNFVASGEPYEPGSMDVGLYARKAAGWYLASTQNIRGGTAGPSTTKSVSPTVTIDGVIYSPASGQAEFAITNLTSAAGTINSFASVSYSVANPPTDVSATASGTTASYAVPFAVIATSGSS